MKMARVWPLAIIVLAAGLSLSQPSRAQNSCDASNGVATDDVLDRGTSSATTMSRDFTDNFTKSAGSGTFGSIDPETSTTNDLHSRARTEEPAHRQQWPDDLD